MTAQISNLRIASNLESLLSKQIEKASPNVSAYIELLKFQSRTSETQLIDYLKLSPIQSSQKLSPSSKIFEKSFSLKAEDFDRLDCEVVDLKPIQEIFDREGRLVQRISSDGSINYKLSYNENITTIVNQINGDIHIQELDNQGRLIREVFPCGLEIMFHFDGDYLSEIILPDQSKVVYQYTDQNHVVVQRVTAEGMVKY